MTLNLALLLLALGLVLTALWFRLDGRAAQREADLPLGDVIASDAGIWRRQTQPLQAPDLGLIGRPDYLIQQRDGGIIPVELKSRKAPRVPFPSHVMQLAAYCLLVEENYGIRPTHGILKYADMAFEIDYTVGLEEELLDVLAAMREDFFADDVDRSHDSAARCHACGVRAWCEQTLADKQ